MIPPAEVVGPGGPLAQIAATIAAVLDQDGRQSTDQLRPVVVSRTEITRNGQFQSALTLMRDAGHLECHPTETEHLWELTDAGRRVHGLESPITSR